VAKVLLRYFPPENAEFWGWAEHLFTQRFGAWLDPLLEAWANRGPPEGADTEERLSNRNLRRNALRLLARRGRGVAADPAVHLAADLALLRLRPEQIKDAEFLAELQDVALRSSALAPPSQASLDAALRRLLEAGLLDDHETISWREAHLSVACQHGFDALCKPDRETYRDLLYYLRTRLGDWRFKGGEWFDQAVGELLGKVPELGEPWRERSRQMLREVREDLQEKAPALRPKVEAALGS